MIYTWLVLDLAHSRVQMVECYESLDAALEDMALLSWEDTDPKLLSFVTDDEGELVATALFGPSMELLVACADGRQLMYPMPEHYREEVA